MASNWRNRRVAGFFALLALVLPGILLLIPMPWFVIQPGSATDVSPFVHVGNIKPDTKGDLLLTTISIRQANLFDYVVSRFSDEVDLIPKEMILAEDESEEEYEKRQKENMIASQNHAVVAAYRLAGHPVSVHVEGIEVFGQVRREPGGLREGDLIRRVDGHALGSVEGLIEYLGTRKPGDTVTVDLVRNGRKVTQEVKLVALSPGKGGKAQAGLGIIPVTRVKVKTDPEVRIQAGEIGGPSAGLMFSLEVLDRLLPWDLTKGYRIAGTGTITDTGEVGQIGGIRHKIVAAYREHAEIFLCPKDVRPGDDNERTAKETARRLGLKITVVPVSSLEEAVRYLESLPQRVPSSFKSKTLTDALRVAYN
jgi:PDZ domain-containing protein